MALSPHTHTHTHIPGRVVQSRFVLRTVLLVCPKTPLSTDVFYEIKFAVIDSQLKVYQFHLVSINPNIYCNHNLNFPGFSLFVLFCLFLCVFCVVVFCLFWGVLT